MGNEGMEVWGMGAWRYGELEHGVWGNESIGVWGMRVWRYGVFVAISM